MAQGEGRLAGRTALITGAGSGIGRETAQIFAREGANVVVADRDLESARATVALVAELGGRAHAVMVDVAQAREENGHVLLVNEIAPRVHNSGHWTLDGASISQFEQHIRAVAGWPLAAPRRYGRIEMINLIGAEAAEYAHWLMQPNTSVHLYGKTNVRPGRKMGHVTRVML